MFFGVLLGISLSYIYWYFTILYKFIKEQNLIYSKLKSIDIEKLVFDKRIDGFVYFKQDNNIIFLDLKKGNTTFYDKKNNIYYFSSLLKNNIYATSLYDNIYSHFKNDIEDIIEVDGYIYSRNTFNQFNQIMTDISTNFMNGVLSGNNGFFAEEKPALNLDLILDKINISGIKSLTKEELEFLQKQK